MDVVFEFSDKCIRFVVNTIHFDQGIIIQNQDELHDLYFKLINTFREDLGIETIDESLKNRIIEMKPI